MYPILFKIGFLKVYTYGFLIALGFVLGFFLALRQAKKENISERVINDVFFWIFISGFMGARISYIFTEWPYFLEKPFNYILANEGFIFYGGFLSSFLFAYIYLKIKRLSFLKVVDLLAPSLVIAHAFGRLGCFSYGCCYGRPTESFLGVLFPKESPAGVCGVPVIPVQLIESFVLVLIFFILIITRRFKKYDGDIFFIYIILYGTARFIIEFYRADYRGSILNVSTSQFIALVLVPIGIIMLFRARIIKSGK